MIAVGGSNFNLGYPSFIQGTASPVGTVMATQTRFSIQCKHWLKVLFLESIKVNR